MKRIITSVFLAVIIAAMGATSQTAHAAGIPASQPVQIQGTAWQEGKVAVGTKVLVECQKTGFVSSAVTNAKGAYAVRANQNQCPLGSLLRVKVNVGTVVGLKTGIVKIITKIDITIIQTHPIPEYGLIGSLMATTAGVGAIAFVRRRYYRGGL